FFCCCLGFWFLFLVSLCGSCVFETGAGLCGRVCAGVFAVGYSAAVGALFDAAGNSKPTNQKPEGLPPEAWNYADGR
ncbi:colicin V family bacteriocin, partial [Escherichia coli]|uniref:colicin V family bacteriocin n=1 Tax=Escherichia coli TaxID=562 RepID=UPI00201FF308